jgi:hypothetical protein
MEEMEKKQTAVDWLADELSKYDIHNPISLSNWNILKQLIIDQAKEMEKNQIVNAFEIGYDNGACVQEGNALYHGSNYYNKNFQ